jgi:hypothetical protein
MSAREKLIGLLEYTERMAALGERAIFRMSDYRLLVFHEKEFQSRVGIYHDVLEGDERVWLKLERFVRQDPPPVPDAIKAWVTVGRDPFKAPNIQSSRVTTIRAEESEALLANGRAVEADIQPALRARDGIPAADLRDVILRLENDSEASSAIQRYIGSVWAPWAEDEKPRRDTIKIYESIFTLQQAIETQGVERPIEVVWGVGIALWRQSYARKLVTA